LKTEFGESWRRTFYSAIRDSLNLDEKSDLRSRDLLYSLLKDSDYGLQLANISSVLDGNDSIIFGAGPSIESDIEGLLHFISRKHPVIVAADGAAEALLTRGIRPDIVVSDLDSCSVETLKLCSKSGCVFVHAHGDNADLMKAIVPQISSNRVGTTQVASRDPVHNFGGFTDGDRACFVAGSFNPSRLIIAGMDFGSDEGRFSVNRYSNARNPKRPLKLEWGKKSLEFLISNARKTRFQNVTKLGLEINGAPKVEYREIN